MPTLASLSRKAGPKLTIDEMKAIAPRRMGETKMKITADSSGLVRAAVQDDAHQARRAGRVLQEADLVAVPIPVFANWFG